MLFIIVIICTLENVASLILSAVRANQAGDAFPFAAAAMTLATIFCMVMIWRGPLMMED